MSIRDNALSLLGAPYVLGCEPWYNEGAEPSADPRATDCSGLVYGVMRRSGIPWSDGRTFRRLTADDYWHVVDRIPRPSRVGDVGFMVGTSGRAHHIVLYVGGEVVEARGRAWGVVKSPLESVDQRGARWGRFPWIGGDDMDDLQDELLKLNRVSAIARSWGDAILEAKIDGDEGKVRELRLQQRAAVEAERLRLGLRKDQVSTV